MVLKQHMCIGRSGWQKPLHRLSFDVDWLNYIIGPLVLLSMVFHFLKDNCQSYGWGLGYVNKQ
jgi:hypothetical protein